MLGRRFNKKEPFILISKPIKDNSGLGLFAVKEAITALIECDLRDKGSTA